MTTFIHTVLQMGSHHSNFCEDFLITTSISPNIQLHAVMDGCSSGNHSHFASTLIGKILQKISIEQSYLLIHQPQTLEKQLQHIIYRLFEELRNIKNSLLLHTHDLLSTALILLLDSSQKTACFVALGDGVLCCNGAIIEFDSDNKPDYLAYHLDEKPEIYVAQQKIWTFNNIQAISICTDGIFTFAPFDVQSYPKAATTPLEDLLKQFDNVQNTNDLVRKLRRWEIDFGLKPTDDLAIVACFL